MYFLSPKSDDPTKTHQQTFATHPDPGQSQKFVYVYAFLLSLIATISARNVSNRISY